MLGVRCAAVPVEFLSDEQARAFGRFTGIPTREDLDRFAFLDDADLELISRRRSDYSKLGYGLQLVTVRWLGTFLPDPLDVPVAVLDYVASQIGVADASCVKRYTERRPTRFEHQAEIVTLDGWREFGAAQADLKSWIDDRAWTTGDGPKLLFDGAVAWLRERRVLLPGVTTLARLVAQVREETAQRLYDTLAGQLTGKQARLLDQLLEVPAGERVSLLEGWRRGPTRTSGTALVRALQRAEEVAAMGMGELDLVAVPWRRVADLARYGMAAKAPLLRRHPRARRLATLLATVRWLESRTVDDALELFDVVLTTELLARAERESSKEKLRRYPRIARDAGRLAAAMRVVLEAIEWGEDVPLQTVWDAIDNVVPRDELRAAVDRVTEVLPPPDADPNGEWRASLVERYASVRTFVPLLCRVIKFDATAQAAPVLAAMSDLPNLMITRPTQHVPAGYLDARRVAVDLVPPGWWQRLVFTPERPEVTVHRAGYVFCVLEQFHRHLKKGDIFAVASARWSDPRAKLLTGPAWDATKSSALNALQLPADPSGLLAGNARDLDTAWRHAAAGITPDRLDRLDEDGRLHAGAVEAVPDPPSLVDLRRRTAAMIPHVDLPELILEVMAWHPGFAQAFTAVSGSRTRLADLHVSVAAALTAHALNVGYRPVISPGVAALTRDRISHVDQNYLRPDCYASANAVLITAQSSISLAKAWGGGLVAAVDGMRFVVPARSAQTRPNPRYFHRRRGVTWLNMISDQAVGTAGRVVSGTPRDSLHLIDLIYSQDGGARPEVVITDTGSYSDVVFGLLTLLGFDYRPQLADLPDAKLWRIDQGADYGPLTATARGRIDTVAIARHWPDILRIVASIHTGAASAHDILRVVSRGGSLTQLGEAIAHYGRIFKTLHVLTFVDDESYRRDIKFMRNLQEGRHDLGRSTFHGRRGDLYQAYRDGMEDQLGALGLVLNCITLWNTVYLDAAVEQLRANGYPVRGEDVARLSPYIRRHINVHGHYSFQLPELSGRRPLRDPEDNDDELSTL